MDIGSYQYTSGGNLRTGIVA